MIEINLLPWRNEMRILQKKDSQRLLFSGVIIAIFFWLVIHMGLGWIIQKKQIEIQHWQVMLKNTRPACQKINILQAQHKQLKQILQIFNKIDAAQLQLLHFFNIILNEPSGEIFLNSITQQDNSIKMLGFASSPLLLTQFINMFRAANLIEIKQHPQANLQFKFQVRHNENVFSAT